MLIEDIDSNELIPKSLNNWNDINLLETYNHAKSKKIKKIFFCEIWYRSEINLLKLLHT